MNIIPDYSSSSTQSSDESHPLVPTDSVDSRTSALYDIAFNAISFELDFDSVISLETAKQRLSQIANGKFFWGLNSLNLLHIEVMRTMQALMKNGEVRKHNQELLDGISTKFHIIFRAFRQYSAVLKGKNPEKKNKSGLIKALSQWYELKELISQLKSQIECNEIYGTKKHITKLKEFSDIIYHLSSTTDFIDFYCKPLTTENNMEDHVKRYHPSSDKMNLYVDSLRLCSNSLTLYRKHLDNKLLTPLQHLINSLSKKNSIHLKPLVTLLKSYPEAIKTRNDPQFIEDLVTASLEMNNEAPLNCLAHLGSLQSYGQFIQSFSPIIKLWEPMRRDFESFIRTLDTESDKIQKEIKIKIDQLEKSKKLNHETHQSLKEICSKEHFNDLFNPHVIESFRIPLLIMQEIAYFSIVIQPIQEAGKNFQTIVTDGKPSPSHSFSAMDLLLQQISEFITPNSDSFQEVMTTLFKLSCELFIIEDPSTMNQIQGLDSFTLLQRIGTKLLSISQKLLPLLNDDCELKASLISMINYIIQIPNDSTSQSSALKHHFLSTLLEPINPLRETITNQDLYWIKKHAALKWMLTQNDPTQNHLENLEQLLLKKIEDSPESGKSFWNLNLKSVQDAISDTKKTNSYHQKCAEALLKCTDVKEVLFVLKDWKDNAPPPYKWQQQFNILNMLAGKQNLPAIHKTIQQFIACNNAMHYIDKALHDISNRNPIKIILKSKKTPEQPFQEKELIKKTPKEKPTIIPFTQDVHLSTPFHTNLELLGQLESTSDDLQTRLIKNARLYYHLIEESRKLPSALKARSKLDHLLLLELTEKMALTSLNICNNTLINTHDGIQLIKGLPTWFQKIIPLVEIQEGQLKRAYWFKEDPTSEKMTPIIKVCENAWENIAKSPQNLNKQKIQLLQTKNKKVEIPTGKLTNNSIQDLLKKCQAFAATIDPQCREFELSLVEVVERIADSASSLDQIASPFFYTVRASEIQIALLSTLMQLVLCTKKVPSDQIHPLFRLEEGSGRPLAFSHNLKRLWKAVNKECPDLDKYLPLFNGDPRYPYPGGTPLTDDIIATFEISYLLKKIEDNEFFNETDIELFKTHLGNGSWQFPPEKQTALLKEKLDTLTLEQIKKTALAFDLGERILSILG